MTDSLLDFVPAPLLEEFTQGLWVPLVGAGMSLNATTPDGRSPADWSQLAKALALELDTPDDLSPIEVISEYSHLFGRPRLVDRVAILIRVHDAAPGAAHVAFARIGFETVVTTNFDFLLERAFEGQGKTPLPILDETQWSSRNRYPGPRLVKFHGDTHHPTNLVLTEDDYDSFVRTHPLSITAVSAMFVDHTPVLIGYSLDDPDLRQLFGLLRDRLGPMMRSPWTIQIGASPRTVERYARRGVKVVNLPRSRGATYGDTLAIFFDQLAEYSRREVIAESQATVERGSAELVLPPRSNQICYVAAPLSLLGWYKETVYPVIEAAGYVPLSARDVVTPPGTVLTKVDALIERASLVIVDESDTESSGYERLLALRRSSQGTVLFISGPESESSASRRASNMTGVRVLVRPDPGEGDEEFTYQISQWLETADPDGAERRRQEPSRLFEAREYRAALVSAVSLLDSAVRRQSNGDFRITSPSYGKSTPQGLLSMVESLIPDLYESSDLWHALDQSVRLRNKVVHDDGNVTRAQAKLAIDAVDKILIALGRTLRDP